MTTCARTCSTKSSILKRNPAKPKSSKLTRSCVTSKPTTSTPFPTTSVTKWCTTRESSIPVPSKPTPTDTRKPSKTQVQAKPSQVTLLNFFELWTLCQRGRLRPLGSRHTLLLVKNQVSFVSLKSVFNLTLGCFGHFLSLPQASLVLVLGLKEGPGKEL